MRSETAVPQTERNINASQTSGLDELKKSQHQSMKNTFFMTGIQKLGRRPGSTMSEQIEGEQSSKPMFRSTINDFRLNKTINRKFISAYDTNMDYKFKTIKFETKIREQFASAKKKHNFQGMMKNLREAFESKAMKEMSLMKQKKTNFKKAMNEIIFQKNKSQMKLDNLIKEFQELDRLVYTGNLNLQKKEQSLSNKLNVAKGRYNNSKRQEKRLQKIIEICFLNKDLNEEWIRVSAAVIIGN